MDDRGLILLTEEGAMLYDSNRYDDPEWNLWDLLREHVDDWHEAYRTYWRTVCNPEDGSPNSELREIFTRMDEAAPHMLRHVFQLRLIAADDQGAIEEPWQPDMRTAVREVLSTYGGHPIVRDRWSFSIADDAVERMRDSCARSAELLPRVLLHKLDERTAAYVARVARLYIYGFDVEALVMCRAALDTALQEAISDEEMVEIGFIRSGPSFSIASRIAAAERAGVFDAEQKASAHALRIASNEALHTAPGFLHSRPSGPLEAIGVLVGLLEALSLKRG